MCCISFIMLQIFFHSAGVSSERWAFQTDLVHMRIHCGKRKLDFCPTFSSSYMAVNVPNIT